MKNSILLKDLSENNIDKVIINDQIKAGFIFSAPTPTPTPGCHGGSSSSSSCSSSSSSS